MRTAFALTLLLSVLALEAGVSVAQDTTSSATVYDATLAKSLGADERGMRNYVLVVLKTGPTKVPAGAQRDKMFEGHFANINRLASEGKLLLAGPSDGVEGWRGIFIFATADLEEAKKYVATDPVITSGEMVAEYHQFYGSAGLMLVNETHKKIAKP